LAAWPNVMDNVRALLLAKYKIDHVTLQPELSYMSQHDAICAKI